MVSVVDNRGTIGHPRRIPSPPSGQAETHRLERGRYYARETRLARVVRITGEARCAG